MRIELTPAFITAFPEGIFGALAVRGCPNRPHAAYLDTEKRAIETRLRDRFASASPEALDADPVARAYAGYLRRHGARYPVVHQARTVLHGRPIESPSALVEAMFAAEIDSLILTSGHDLDSLAGPPRDGGPATTLVVDAAGEGETYTKLSEKHQVLRQGDMIVRDAEGIIASVVYGPDHRTRLRPESTAALFGAWCPVGLAVPVVRRHLDTLGRLLRLEWPEAAIDPPHIASVATIRSDHAGESYA